MELMEKIAIAAVTGAFGLVPVVLQWTNSVARRRDRATHLQQLRNELEFLERWSALNNQLPGAQDSAAASLTVNLDQAMARLLTEYQALPVSRRTEPQGITQSRVRRALLLYAPPTRLGRLWHTLFYILILMGGAMIISDLLNPTYDPQTGQNEFIYLLVGVILLLGPPLFLLHYLARKEAKRVTAPAREAESAHGEQGS